MLQKMDLEPAKNGAKVTATLVLDSGDKTEEASAKLLTIKRNSMYSIPPPNYKFDPCRSNEILL